MEENVLKSFETFKEFPEKYLMINGKSDYYFVRYLGKNYVAKSNIDLATPVIIKRREKILSDRSFYNVLDGSCIYKCRYITDYDGTEERVCNKDKAEVLLLTDILNIKENQVYYLTKEDIDALVNYKEESAKTYNNKPRKNYF